jgi:hypothetical protein
MPPRAREPRIAPVERLDDGDGVHDDESRDCGRMVECRAEGDVRAAIMADDGEAIVAERSHQRDAVARHRAFRVRLVIPRRRRLRRLAIAAKVRADDGVAGREERRGAVPGGVRPGVPVQEEDRRAGSAVANAKNGLARVDPVERESREERLLVTVHATVK